MDVGRAFSYVFQDPRWLTKGLIALVMLIIPVIGWLILFGYILRIVRQVATDSDTPLPEWDDFGRDLALGFKGAVAWFVWSLPATFVSACSQALSFVSSGNEPQNGAAASFAVLAVCLGCLSFILSLATTFVMPLPLSRLAITDRLGEAFAVAAIFSEIGRVATTLLIVLVLSIVLGILALFGVLLCLVGVLATLLYAYFVQAHLWGQVRRQLLSGSASATPVPTTG